VRTAPETNSRNSGGKIVTRYIHPPELLDGPFLLDLVLFLQATLLLFPGRKINLGSLWASV
jgi:hypothetical protein